MSFITHSPLFSMYPMYPGRELDYETYPAKSMRAHAILYKIRATHLEYCEGRYFVAGCGWSGERAMREDR